LYNNSEAIGIISCWRYWNNGSRLKYAPVDGVVPSYDQIGKRAYTFSRELYFYARNSDVCYWLPLRDFIDLFLSEEMIGDFGQLQDIGLIALPKR
jgi:phosphate transport system substrate-binding protein